MSKFSAFKNCCEARNSLPVYQVPPPSVIELSVDELIDPVDPAAKLEVNHCVLLVVLSL